MDTHTQKINPVAALIGAILVTTVFLFSGEACAQRVHSDSGLTLHDSVGLAQAPDISIQTNPEILPPPPFVDSTDLMYMFLFASQSSELLGESTDEEHPMNLLSDSGVELVPAVMINLEMDGEIIGAALGVKGRF